MASNKKYRLRPPAGATVGQQFSTPHEVLVRAHDGTYGCNMNHTREQLTRWGWTVVESAKAPKTEKAAEPKSAGKSKKSKGK